MDTVTSVTSRSVQYEIGDAKAREEKLNISDLPSSLSAFSNDMGFIDKTVSNLMNYYLKSETYSRTEINEYLSARLLIQVVDELPTEEISTNTIYFIKRKSEEQVGSDVYDEYIHTGGTWEQIGDTYVDLSDYYTKSETDAQIEKAVTAEEQARELSEATLQNNIDIVQSNLDNTNDNLNSEIATRQARDLAHETSIDTTNSNLDSEITRATNAESVLSDRCDTYDGHVADVSNPHSVTAEQVGLGNVTNVPTTDTITNGSTSNITSGAVYTALSDKVDKVSGYGLSQQNFTLEEKTKLSNLENYDDTSITERMTSAESAIETINGDSSVEGSVDKKILDAVSKINSFEYEIVTELPETGVKGTIYFVLNTDVEETGNKYDEYIYMNDTWELLGQTVVNIRLSDYYTKAEISALVSVKNDKITVTDDSDSTLADTNTFSTSDTSGSNPTAFTRFTLSKLWTYMKGKLTGSSNGIALSNFTYGEIES